jgi:anti-sigma factor RsiW
MTCPDPQIREELGAYALGLSEPEDRERVERHLESCPACRADLESLGGVVAALGGLPPTAVEEIEPPDDEELMRRLVAARRRERRSQVVGRSVGGLGLAGMLVAGAVAFDLGRRPVDPTPAEGATVALQSPEGAAPTAGTTVRLTARDAGTQVDLETSTLPPVAPGQYYKVWLIGPNGERVGVGTFRPERDGRTTVRLQSAEPLEPGTRFGLTRGEQELLLVGAPRGRA